MTMALCFSCGAVKFGAICPCDDCGCASTGDMNLDIMFSDHNYSVDSLERLGEALKEIRVAADDDMLAFWTFMRYLSETHGELLSVNTLPPYTERSEHILNSPLKKGWAALRVPLWLNEAPRRGSLSRR